MSSRIPAKFLSASGIGVLPTESGVIGLSFNIDGGNRVYVKFSVDDLKWLRDVLVDQIPEDHTTGVHPERVSDIPSLEVSSICPVSL